ncbi:anti-sigma B factor RsbW [Bacillus sp. JJ722]|uniref:anti-sigma B factor RsbW n=1 Tax=Bacillus sp. JJ722 TaxID=3122973 RepID=UPI002FFEF7A8
MKQGYDYVEMKVPAKPEYIGIVRLTLSGIASRMGFLYEDIEDLKVAVSEACTNAVQHAYTDENRGEVVIGFGLYHDRLEMMVVDNGNRADLEQVRRDLGPYEEHYNVEFLREGGLGLYLIETLMDKVIIHQNQGVTVFMTKFLEREQVEADAETIST